MTSRQPHIAGPLRPFSSTRVSNLARLSIRRRLERPAAAALLVLLALAVLCWPRQARAENESQLPSIERWTLPNGLQVAYVGVHKSPVVAVQVWYRVGSKDEPKTRKGMAHLFQNLIFQGSEHVRPTAHAKFLSQTGGYANATALEDASATQNLVPRPYFELAMRLEADRMRGLVWSEDALKAARRRAEQELQRATADPSKRVVWRFLELAFPKHPYGWEALGERGTLAKVTLDDVKAFYKSYYVPNNALLVVVGDVNRKDVERIATEQFGSIPKAKDPQRQAPGLLEPTQTRARRKTLKGSQLGLVMRGFHIPEATHKDIYALQVLSILLGPGRGGALDASLRANGLAAEAGASAMVREHPGLFLIFATYRDASKTAELERAITAILSKLQSKPPTKKQLRVARNRILSDFVFRIEPTDGLAGQIGMSWILTRNPAQFITDVAQLEAVSPADITRVASTYLIPTNSTTVVAAPAAP